MKKKGFTLVELLAVIVVLAMIALIAIPTVSKVKKNARISSIELSATNYIKAVDLLMSTMKLSGTLVSDGVYEIDSEGNLPFGAVEFSGTRPNGGSIVVKKGEVVKRVSAIEIEDYTVTYKDGVANTEETKEATSELAELCTLVTGTANTIGAKYTCDLGSGEKTFYVLEAGTSSKAATLILEGNYDMTTQAWCDQEGENPMNNVCAADGLTGKLDEIAEVWSKLDRSQIGLPSASQIVVADGQAEDAYLDFVSLSNEWLYGGKSYWTSTPNVFFSDYAWRVGYYGRVDANLVDVDFNYGVRPVITLSI